MPQKIFYSIKFSNIAIITLAIFLLSAGGAYLIFGRGKADGKAGGAAKSPAPALTASPENPANEADSANSALWPAPEAIAEISNYQYTETYNQPIYGFSFKYPKAFAVSEISSNGSKVILVQNTLKNIGVQIVISPFDGADSDITEAFIKSELPDLKISEPREVLVGSGRKGLAFMSDNAAFGGKSREVWFVFNNNLYQISAYAELDGFLKGLFGTWKFI